MYLVTIVYLYLINDSLYEKDERLLSADSNLFSSSRLYFNMKDIIFYKSIMFLPLVRIAPEFLVRQPSPFLPPLLHNIASSACWTAE